MTTTTETDTDNRAQRGITFFEADQAPLLDDDGMMTPPHVEEVVTTTLDLSPLAAGSHVTVLFKTDSERWQSESPA